MAKRTCVLCGDPHKALGYCNRHHQRLLKWGDPEGPPHDLDSSDDERWLPIPGFGGLYDVSDLGRVRSLPLHRPGRKGGRHGKILSADTQHALHQRVTLYRDGRRSRIFVHRLVMLAFVGPCPAGLETRHLNGDATDNRLVNLVYGTRQENALDRTLHGVNRNALKTHCPQGHEYTPENTYKSTTGRICRTCRRERGRLRHQGRRRAA